MQATSYTIRYIRFTFPQLLQQYQNRAMEPVPNTPLIVLGEQNGQLLTIYVEELSQKNIADQLKEKNLDYKLSFFHQIIFTFLKLREKYGCFRIDKKFITINQNNQPRAWIHTDPISLKKQFPLPDCPNSQRIMINSLQTIFKQIIFNLDSLDRCDTLKELLIEVSKLIQKMSSISNAAKQELNDCQKKQIGNFLKEKFRKQRESNYNASQKPQYKHYKSFFLTDSVNVIKKSSFFNGSTLNKTNGFIQGKNKNTDPKLVHLEAKKLLQKIKHSSKPQIEGLRNLRSQRNMNEVKVSNIQLEKNNLDPYRTKLSQIISTNHQEHEISQLDHINTFEKSKFPYSTSSTFVTFKSLEEIPMSFETEIQVDDNPETISNSTKNGIQQNEIENEFESLFLDDNEENQINQEEYERRQSQFSGILFS